MRAHSCGAVHGRALLGLCTRWLFMQGVLRLANANICMMTFHVTAFRAHLATVGPVTSAKQHLSDYVPCSSSCPRMCMNIQPEKYAPCECKDPPAGPRPAQLEIRGTRKSTPRQATLCRYQADTSDNEL